MKQYITKTVRVAENYREYKLNNYRDKQDKELYQYVTNNKIEYTATISYNKKNVIKGFVPKEYSINYDSTPIYFKEESKVILPKDMAIILPDEQAENCPRRDLYEKDGEQFHLFLFPGSGFEEYFHGNM